MRHMHFPMHRKTRVNKICRQNNQQPFEVHLTHKLTLSYPENPSIFAESRREADRPNLN